MTNEKHSWQYDPFVQFSCTIGNQFEVLMLIEMLETKGIHIVSANTDGILCLFPKELADIYYEVCHEWERIVGNDKQGMLEYVDYKGLVQENINSYIALKKEGKPKVKGRLNHIPEKLSKNNTKDITRIQRLAIQKFFDKQIPVAETIKNEKNIFMFVFGQKLTKDYHFKQGDEELLKMVRFYISKTGIKLTKVKNEDSDATGAELTNLMQSAKVVIYNNHIPQPIENYKLDYDFYIEGAEIVIRNIQTGQKGKGKFINPQQTQLF